MQNILVTLHLEDDCRSQHLMTWATAESLMSSKAYGATHHTIVQDNGNELTIKLDVIQKVTVAFP